MPRRKKKDLGLQKRIASMIIVAVLAFFAGRYTVITQFDLPIVADLSHVQEKAKNGSFNKGYEHALKELNGESDLLLNQTITYLSNAIVTKVSSDLVEVQVSASSLDSSKEGLVVKTVQVPVGVKIVEKTPISFEEVQRLTEEFQKRYEALSKKIANGVGEPEDLQDIKLPSSYNVREFQLSELKEGDALSIITKNDVRATDRLQATSIELIR